MFFAIFENSRKKVLSPNRTNISLIQTKVINVHLAVIEIEILSVASPRFHHGGLLAVNNVKLAKNYV